MLWFECEISLTDSLGLHLAALLRESLEPLGDGAWRICHCSWVGRMVQLVASGFVKMWTCTAKESLQAQMMARNPANRSKIHVLRMPLSDVPLSDKKPTVSKTTDKEHCNQWLLSAVRWHIWKLSFLGWGTGEGEAIIDKQTIKQKCGESKKARSHTRRWWNVRWTHTKE